MESRCSDDECLLSLTPKAVEMVKQAMQEEGLELNHALRVAVKGGGCSGLQYALDFSNSSRPGDLVFEIDGLKIRVDIASASYLKGTVVDYVSGPQGSGFKFNNPNTVRRTCGGCGGGSSC
ncbi:MAG: iron-sulfur cluster assembly accessory protein [Deltaproteobacteria bacterium]|nr:iron-sulfur cluster assembly accessory protein [Deltaproteobacteria bacterium]